MKRRHLINDRDEALFDQNGAIISHLSDQRSKVKMSPHIVCEETCRLITSTGSSSCGHHISRIPPIASDLNRYNSRSTAEIISLILI